MQGKKKVPWSPIRILLHFTYWLNEVICSHLNYSFSVKHGNSLVMENKWVPFPTKLLSVLPRKQTCLLFIPTTLFSFLKRDLNTSREAFTLLPENLTSTLGGGSVPCQKSFHLQTQTRVLYGNLCQFITFSCHKEYSGVSANTPIGGGSNPFIIF